MRNPTARSRALALALVLVCIVGAIGAATCAGPGGAGAGGSKYPPRPANCKVVLIQGPKPAAAAWDDLGMTEATCHLDDGQLQCLQKLRAAACRMGGDVVYDVPKKALRPTEQGMAFHGRVAHTRASKSDGAEPSRAGAGPDLLPPPASEEESRGPVIPLGTAAPPSAPSSGQGGDAGASPATEAHP
jgi:hypothetical protein